LAVSWSIGGQATLQWLAAAGILGGLGWAAARLVFRLEEITNRAYQFVHAQHRREQEESPDRLDNRLRRDRDPRTQECLRQLREIHAGFVQGVEAGRIDRATHEILDTVEELFRASAARLEASYQLWQTSRRLMDEPKRKMLQQRDDLVAEVLDTIDHLRSMTQRCIAVTIERDNDQIERLQAELEENIEVARRTEQRIASWENGAGVERSGADRLANGD